MTAPFTPAALLEGLVRKTNDKGFYLVQNGQPEGTWLNFSKFGTEAVPRPIPGDRALVTLDKGGYVRDVTIQAHETSEAPSCPAQDATDPPPDKDLRITRLACLKAATSMWNLPEDLDEDSIGLEANLVLKLAARFETWVLR